MPRSKCFATAEVLHIQRLCLQLGAKVDEFHNANRVFSATDLLHFASFSLEAAKEIRQYSNAVRGYAHEIIQADRRRGLPVNEPD